MRSMAGAIDSVVKRTVNNFRQLFSTVPIVEIRTTFMGLVQLAFHIIGLRYE
jgi:hypothetical protein